MRGRVCAIWDYGAGLSTPGNYGAPWEELERRRFGMDTAIDHEESRKGEKTCPDILSLLLACSYSC